MQIADLLNHWQERIERDLTPFVDPGTALHIIQEGRALQASWVQRGSDRAARFTISWEQGAQVDVSGTKMSYQSFYAGPDMADLRALAKTMIQVAKRPVFVQTRAILADDGDTTPVPATDLLRSVLTQGATSDATLVVMVTGEAGAGKTSVLQHLVGEQAEQYARGKTESLYLYVNAQGRALARFNEALATELQDLRAALTYHAVSTLVRLGLLVPVIDGFDELLGVGGYDDAFSSLAQFIEELDGQGQLVASARSTYYEQEFVSRASRASSLGSQVWRQVPVQVLAWGEDQVVSYISQRALAVTSQSIDPVQLRTQIDRVFKGRNESLKTKPLFVARTVDLVLEGVDLSGEGDLLHEVVEAFVERERADKLRNRAGASLLSAAQIVGLLADLAEEMWNQETRELDRRSAHELAELALLEAGLDADAQRTVVKRMPDMCFLMPGEKNGSVAFEHEIFFYFFLASRFANKLVSDGGIPAILLGRSVLPRELADSIVRKVGTLEAALHVRELLGRLNQAASTHSQRSQQIRENSGLLAATILEAVCSEAEPLADVTLAHLVVPGASLNGVWLTNATIRDVELRRTDLSKTRITASKASRCTFHEVLVDPDYTRLELLGLDIASDVFGVRVTNGASIRTLYDPQEAHIALVKIGAAKPMPAGEVPYRRVDREVQTVVQRFVRAYNRSNPVCTSDDNMLGVFTHDSWPTIERALLDSGVVTSEKRASRGPEKLFLRRQVPAEQILVGARRDADVPVEVSAFWKRLEEQFPE